MLCDSAIIYSHMRKVHGQTKKDKASQPFKMRKKYASVCASFRQDTPLHTSSIFINPTIHIYQIPVLERTSKIGNLCLFLCPKCESRSFENYGVLKRHCKTQHNCGLHYNSSLVSEARCHACLLCPKGVLSDRNLLADHLSKQHKMSLLKYERIFHQNGGKVLPTYNNWLKQEYNVDAIDP